MVNTSRWLFHINNMFMKQDITVQINLGEDGEYTFYAVTSKGLKPFPKDAAEKAKIEDDVFSIEISNPKSPKMKLGVEVTFGEETAKGFFKVPIFGKMKFEGERIELTDLPIIEKEVTADDAKEKLEEEADEETAEE